MHYYISIGPGACNLEPSLECMQCHILVVDFILNLSVNFVSYYHRIKIYSHKFTAQNHAIDFYDWAKKGIRIKLKIDYICSSPDAAHQT